MTNISNGARKDGRAVAGDFIVAFRQRRRGAGIRKERRYLQDFDTLQEFQLQYALAPSIPGTHMTTASDCANGEPAPWFVYILECRDGSLYTGIAIDVARRYALHVTGKGARYTRSHPPVRVLATFVHPDRRAAARAEYAIKQLSPGAKRALCAGQAGMSDGGSRRKALETFTL